MTSTLRPDSALRADTGPTLLRASRSELLKLRTLRSHVVLVAVGALFMLALGPIQSMGPTVAPDTVPAPATIDAAFSLVLSGTSTAAILFGVVGVLSVASEYTRRSIRITLTALPRRRHVVLGKAAAVIIAAAVAVLPSAFLAMEAGRRILDAADVEISWTDPGTLRVVLASVWLVTGWAIIGQALAWLFRSAIGAAFALLGLMFVLPPLVQLVAGPRITAILPSEAGVAMLRINPPDGALPSTAGVALWTFYVAAGLVVSMYATARRDH